MTILRDIRIHPYRYLSFAFIFIVTVFLVIAISPKRISGDFDVYYHASLQFLAKSPIYVPHDGINEFKYLPLFAYLFAPLTAFNEVQALYIWSLLSIALFYGMFYFFYKLKLMSLSGPKDFFLIVCLFALAGRYLFSDIKLGQVNILLCFLMVLTMFLEIKGRDFWAGTVLAFSLMLKLFPLLFLVYFILIRKYKIAGYTVLMSLFFLCLPSVYLGFHQNVQYLREWYALLKVSPAPLFYSFKNYSLLSFFSWIFVVRHAFYNPLDYEFITQKLPPVVYYAWGLSCVFFFGLFFYGFWDRWKDVRLKYLDYGCLFVCCLLFNPLAYLNAFVLLVVPYFFILRFLLEGAVDRRCMRDIGALCFLSFFLLIVDSEAMIKHKTLFYAFAQWRPLLGVTILAYLSLWLMQRSFKSHH